nr:paired amphipathic helix protein Sin3-like 2 isoform X3 [Tanacetum cinerariifolium]
IKDHKDGDRDDLDGNAKSKGEAEGIKDENLLVQMPHIQDHILLSAKPLAKRVASLHDGGKKIAPFSMEMNHFTCFFGFPKLLSAKVNSTSAELTLVLLLEISVSFEN